MKKIDTKEKLHYTACGLDYVYLIDGFDLYEDEDGDVSYAIKDVDDLHKSIAYTVITQLPELRGMELRFLRSFLQISQKSLAKCLGKKRDSIAKSEADSKKALQRATDRLLRFYVMEHIKGDTKAREIVDYFRELENFEEKELFFEKKAKEWKSIAA